MPTHLSTHAFTHQVTTGEGLPYSEADELAWRAGDTGGAIRRAAAAGMERPSISVALFKDHLGSAATLGASSAETHTPGMVDAPPSAPVHFVSGISARPGGGPPVHRSVILMDGLFGAMFAIVMDGNRRGDGWAGNPDAVAALVGFVCSCSQRRVCAAAVKCLREVLTHNPLNIMCLARPDSQGARPLLDSLITALAQCDDQLPSYAPPSLTPHGDGTFWSELARCAWVGVGWGQG